MKKQLIFNFTLFIGALLCWFIVWLLNGGLQIALIILPIFVFLMIGIVALLLLVMGLNALCFFLSDALEKKEHKIFPLFITPVLVFITGIMYDEGLKKMFFIMAGMLLAANIASAIKYYRKVRVERLGS